MSAELLINDTLTETRVAYLVNGDLHEIHIERAAGNGIMGNIYKGRVNRVLPGMQAAFVDIGLEKAAFLHADDILSDSGLILSGVSTANKPVDITALVHTGQEIVVQVIKDPISTKGARLTTAISLPSRYLVFMPNASHIAISQRISDENERQRLKDIVADYCDKGGFIIRTAAEGIARAELIADAKFLRLLWENIVQHKKRAPARSMLYKELALAPRIIRDFTAAPLDVIRVDSRSRFSELQTFISDYVNELSDKLTYFSSTTPIFDYFGVERAIQMALQPKVELKSGGYLVIEQTESMTTIDINTGGFVGKSNLEETIVKTNLEAVSVIAQQLQLRNLGGIIIIDFIDMTHESDRQQVLQQLEQALSTDRAKSCVFGFSHLGLVEMTRKRTRESLEHLLCQPCLSCQGTGSMLSLDTVCYELARALQRISITPAAVRFLVYVSSALDHVLQRDYPNLITEMESRIGRKIILRIDPAFYDQQFDIAVGD